MDSDEMHLLLELAGELQPGESRSGLVCPKCSGGSSRERSFSISREDGRLAYMCHRASCSFAGYAGAPEEPDDYRGLLVSGHDLDGSGRRSNKRRAPESLEEVPIDLRRSLEDRYGLADEHIERGGIAYVPDWQRIYIPRIKLSGEHDGYQARSLNPNVVPRTLSDGSGPSYYRYFNAKANTGSQLRCSAPSVLLVVEDAFSALRASLYTDAAALFGTNLSYETASEFFSVYDEVVLALDRDATAKAEGYVKRYGWLGKISILTLDKDLKNLREEELVEKLSESVL